MLLLLACLLACGTAASGLSCSSCGSSPCSMTPPCCPSGEYTLGICGCCPVCAKAEGEECGGSWNMKGTCASSLQCVRGERGDHVIGDYELSAGPFNKWHYVSITKQAGDVYTWTNTAGVKWSMTFLEKKSDAESLFFDVGKDCPYFSKGYKEAKFLLSTEEIEGPWKELYARTSKGLSMHAIHGDHMPGTCRLLTTSPRRTPLTWPTNKCHNKKKCLCGPALSRPASSGYEGGCQDLPNGSGFAEGFGPYCFLENVQNFKDPMEDCFDDVEWSASQGKFYSHDACRKSPQCSPPCPWLLEPVCGVQTNQPTPPMVFPNTCEMERAACQDNMSIEEIPMSFCGGDGDGAGGNPTQPDVCAHDNEFIIGGNNIDGGKALQTEGAADCAKRCTAEPDCQAWTLKKDTDLCWLKKSNHGTAPSDDWTWGPRCNFWSPAHTYCADCGVP